AGDDVTVEQIRKRAKWDNDDYVCKGLIFNRMSDSLFDICQNVESSKELWDSLEAKYMAVNASSKKFLVINFTNYKMTDSRPNVESSKELWDSLEAKYMAVNASSKKLLVINFTNYKMTDSRPVLEQYNKLLDFKNTLKHLKEELTLIELGSHLRIEESLRVQDSDKPKGNDVAGPSVVNM
nr:zinc finger, CCHC-type [Tanacetum cinerariifolium]